MIGKRGVIEAEFLAKLTLALFGFGILIFIWTQLAWSGGVDKKLCHESVIIRGTLPMLTQEIVALKCKPENVCITAGTGGKDCETMKDTKGVTTVKVTSTKDVEKVIANEVLECWRMMGEGKLSLFSQKLAQTYGFGLVAPTCVICSRIGFNAGNLKDKGIDLTQINVENYMRSYIKSGENKTYATLIAGEGGKVTANTGTISVKEITESTNKQGVVEFSFGESEEFETIEIPANQEVKVLESSDLAVIFMQITAPKRGEVFSNTLLTGGILGGTAIFGAPKLTTKILGTVSATTLAAFMIAGVSIQNALVSYNQYFVTAGRCLDVSGLDEAREGCSVVRTVKYDMAEISKYCGIVDGLPA